MNTLYFLFATISYTVMFMIFVRSRRQLSSSSQEGSTQRSLFYWFKHSKFYIAIIIISSFLLCSVIPSIIVSYIFFVFKGSASSFDVELVLNVSNIAMYLSDTIDAFIYFLMYAPIRRLLLDEIIDLKLVIRSMFNRRDDPIAVRGEQPIITLRRINNVDTGQN